MEGEDFSLWDFSDSSFISDSYTMTVLENMGVPIPIHVCVRDVERDGGHPSLVPRPLPRF